MADVAGLVARLRAAGCVFAEDEAELLLAAVPEDAAGRDGALDALVARRVAGEPLEHVVGHAVFHGLRVAVGPGVFVPRRRSEFLVARALDGVRAEGAVTLLDLCCGSGALGLALRTALGPRATLHAADVDPGALRWARHNLAPLGAHVHEGDLYAPLPAALRGRVDVLTANVPYVPSEEVRLLPAEARAHEPLVALDGGRDGLDLVRRVAEEAATWLAPGGRLLVESGERQAPEVAGIFTAAALHAEIAHEEEGWATVVTGTRPHTPPAGPSPSGPSSSGPSPSSPSPSDASPSSPSGV
ncbi:putative protein N(5)-glutamine methyltransferase [Streptomyces sp. CLI2509]|uniref:putative protein N(5)-glutamine methyltransferase n=1 Tax=Streptomyces sp. CLI2509 TaxID=1984801 RepID=UPI001EFFD995|nr:putative protein N(5)-glutamine methyltransferase [Streptomyces sp. CLI2509]